MDEGEFLRQIRSFEEATDYSFINKTYTALISARMSHPFLILRAKHLDSWVQSGDFSKVTGISHLDVDEGTSTSVRAE
jgi:hypothetical protein